jgi:formylglycine-generating enzyme required for sulfatase activity
MVLIPAGEYTVGATKEEYVSFLRKMGDDSPNPVSDEHMASISKRKVQLEAFYILDHEVCNKEYLEFLDYTSHPWPPVLSIETEGYWGFMQIHAWHGRTYPPGRAGFPVMGIYPEDGEAFCKWRTERTGVLHRLPTEDEWEAAYRGKEGNVFPWGNEWKGQKRIALGRWPEVGPDPFYAWTDDTTSSGIKFMMGNVAEYTIVSPLKRGEKRTDGKEVRYVGKGGDYISSLRPPPHPSDRSPGPKSSMEYPANCGPGFRYVIPAKELIGGKKR